MQRPPLLAPVALAAVATLLTPAFATRRARDVEALLPPDTFAAVGLPGLSRLLDRGFDDPFVRSVLEGPAGRLALARSEVTPRAAVMYASGLLGEPLLPALASLTREGSWLGLVPGVRGPEFLLVVRGDDPERWERALDRALEWLAESPEVPDDLPGAFERVAGARLWDLGEPGAFAQRGALFVLAGERSLVEDTLRRAQAAGSRDGVSSAKGSTPPLCVAWFDREKAEAALGPEALLELSRAARDPGAHTVLGSGLAFLTEARRLEARLDLDGARLALELLGRGIDLTAAEGLVTPPGGARRPALPATTPTTQIQAVLHRDLAALFARRADLFPATELPSFAQAASDLGPLLGGLDLEEELLPALGPWVRVVVREVELDSAFAPSIRLPAAAVLVEVREPERVGRTLVAAFQSLVAITNVERAQAGRPPLVLSLERVGEHEITRAAFPPPAPGDEIDVAYNLEPACALVDRTFLVGTHAHLVEELVRQLERGEVETPPPGGDLGQAFGPALARTLAMNRAAFVSSGILDEGKTPEEAEFEADLLVALARTVRRVVYSTGRPAEDVVAAHVELELVPPPEGER